MRTVDRQRVGPNCLGASVLGFLILALCVWPSAGLADGTAAFDNTPSATEPGGMIRGMVVAREGGEPGAGSIFIFPEEPDLEPFPVGFAEVDAQGRYQIDDVEAGGYFAVFRASSDSGFSDQVFDDISCPRFCQAESGTLIDVEAGQVTDNIDFLLDRLPIIQGTVRDARTGEPVAGVHVMAEATASGGPPARAATSGDDGVYRILDLRPGNYRLTATSADHVIELYDDIQCFPIGCSFAGATAIGAALNRIIGGRNFDLIPGASVSGQVVRQDTSMPVELGEARLYDTSGRAVATMRLNEDDATFRLQHLPAGTYFLVLHGSNRFFDQVYGGPACEAWTCDPTTGTPIVLVEGQAFDALEIPVITPLCERSETRLCLERGRFAVEGTWRDPEGQGAEARAFHMSDDSGYLWFFDYRNVEVVVKVLNGCGEPQNTFWVFAAGLTDLEVNLTVTDLLTGEAREYSNTLGVDFEPIIDTAAFATCDQQVEGLTGVIGESESRVRRLGASRDLDIFTPPFPVQLPDESAGLSEPTESTHETVAQGKTLPQDEAVAPTQCLFDEFTFCLYFNRFRVWGEWTAPNGTSGRLRRDLQVENAGFFWIFDEANLEVVVKVLDACTVEPFNNLWVFAAGLTDLEIELFVEDTATGEIRTYTNPLGTPFVPIQDTQAFTECYP